MATEYGQLENAIPLVSPQDIAATATATPFVALKTAHAIAFQVQFGAITSASADQNIVVTVEAATAAATGGESAIAFKYRLSGAVGTNTLGALTSATTSGATIASTDDNKTLWVYLQASEIAAALADASHVRAVITPDAGYSATLVAVNAYIKPRYQSVTMTSAT